MDTPEGKQNNLMQQNLQFHSENVLDDARKLTFFGSVDSLAYYIIS
jgi:hypothetical protein